MKKLIVSPSPHEISDISTRKIMLTVIIALIPAIIAGCVFFGLRALLVVAVCSASSVFFEYISRIIMKREQTTADLSALLTGILLGLNLPVTIPFWIAIVGSFVAVVIVKQLFGGLGQNFANPAITARIVLLVSFSGAMTNWAVPMYWKTSEIANDITNSQIIVTGATPLVSRDASLFDLFIGNTGGCIGETSALALLIGGLFLIIRKVISPSTPVSYLGTVALLTLVYGGNVPYELLSGGLLLGAFFMATDYVTTPVTETGKIIFGIGCGIITFIIRQFGSYPEGVSFSILLMNILTPYIDRFTMTKPLGAVNPKKEEKENA